MPGEAGQHAVPSMNIGKGATVGSLAVTSFAHGTLFTWPPGEITGKELDKLETYSSRNFTVAVGDLSYSFVAH